MNKNIFSLLYVPLFFVSSNTYAFGMSDGIMNNKDDECAIYLCLPTGFTHSECSSAHSAYIRRVTNVNSLGIPYYTPLPNFYLYCNDTSDQNGSYNTSQIGYIERIDAHIPEHKECLSMATEKICIKKQGRECIQYKTIKYCNAWKDVPEHYIENTRCDATGSSEHYKLDDKGQIIGSYHVPEWCDRTVTTVGVTVDGVIQGDSVRY